MKLLLCAVAGYLLGSISVSILVTKYIFHADLRQQGSGNAGATNAARVYGLGAGVLTFAGDFAKSILAMLLGRGLGGVMGLAVGRGRVPARALLPGLLQVQGRQGRLRRGGGRIDDRLAAVCDPGRSLRPDGAGFEARVRLLHDCGHCSGRRNHRFSRRSQCSSPSLCSRACSCL